MPAGNVDVPAQPHTARSRVNLSVASLSLSLFIVPLSEQHFMPWLLFWTIDCPH